MHKPSPLALAFRHGSSRIAPLAAAVLLVALIGGLVTGLILVHHGSSNTGAAPSSTATPIAPSTTDLSFSTIEMKDTANGWATAFLQSNPTAATHILHTTDGGGMSRHSPPHRRHSQTAPLSTRSPAVLQNRSLTIF